MIKRIVSFVLALVLFSLLCSCEGGVKNYSSTFLDYFDTFTTVSGLKYFSSLLNFSSTASLIPGVNSMFLPVIVILMLSTPLELNLAEAYIGFLLCLYYKQLIQKRKAVYAILIIFIYFQTI